MLTLRKTVTGIALATLATAWVSPSIAQEVKRYRFAYDQPSSTGYGVAGDLFQRSNYGDYMRYAEVDLAIAADAEATLPALIDEVKRLTTADRKRATAGS